MHPDWRMCNPNESKPRLGVLREERLREKEMSLARDGGEAGTVVFLLCFSYLLRLASG